MRELSWHCPHNPPHPMGTVLCADCSKKYEAAKRRAFFPNAMQRGLPANLDTRPASIVFVSVEAST